MQFLTLKGAWLNSKLDRLNLTQHIVMYVYVIV